MIMQVPRTVIDDKGFGVKLSRLRSVRGGGPSGLTLSVRVRGGSSEKGMFQKNWKEVRTIHLGWQCKGPEAGASG
jgi:hypothetical protein